MTFHQLLFISIKLAVDVTDRLIFKKKHFLSGRNRNNLKHIFGRDRIQHCNVQLMGELGFLHGLTRGRSRQSCNIHLVMIFDFRFNY